jgi:hypothetical protein
MDSDDSNISDHVDQVFHINYESNEIVPTSCTTVWTMILWEVKNLEPK